jgi:hypothetical protein
MNRRQEKTKWPELAWDLVVDKVSKCTFRIYAGKSAGTGFVVSLGSDKKQSIKYLMMVTAWHVVEGVIGNDEPIRFVSADKKISIGEKGGACGIFRLGPPKFDIALIMFGTRESILSKKELLPMLPFESVLARGAEIGWIGFPGLVEPELCFFKGVVSGYLNDPPTYLVDGVAINGVSGGPVFDNRAHLIGIVSAYIPNRLDELNTLPGLMVAVPITAVRYWMEKQLRAIIL